MSTQDPVELDSLLDAYDVVAEMGTHEDGRTFIAKRRDNGADVLIRVVRTPNGDEKNALTLFAADTQLLSRHTHRNLVPIIEGRWVGADAFAVVSERVVAPTLEELLARGEEFSSSRVATILRDVDGVLEWARGQKVVHRDVSASSVFVEPGTDRVLIAFVIRPIPVFGAPDADGDARTIARLAWMMLARTPQLPEGLPQSLSELRPDLPERVVAETETLLHSSLEGQSVPDIRSYVARIAMADALKVGEEESTRVHTALLEEQRAAREQWDVERAELERASAEQTRRLAEERAELEGAIAKEREELAAQRAELEGSIAREREELEQSIAQERAALAAQRQELERSIASERDQLAVERQELQQIGAAAVQHREEVDDGLDAVTFVDEDAGTKHSSRARWAMAGAAAALLAIVASALAIGNRGLTVASSNGSGANRTLAPVVVDSAAGGITADVAAPPARVRNASPAVAAPRQDSTDSTASVPVPARRRAPVAVRDSLPVDSLQPFDSLPVPASVRPAIRVPRIDSLSRDTLSRPDSVGYLNRQAARDSAIVAPRKPAVKPDSLVRRDSMGKPKPDTLARPDMTAA